jgi:uncharacterized protein (TIGR00251 family)
MPSDGTGYVQASMLDIDRDGNVIVSVHVQPGARDNRVMGRHGDALRVRVTAPPVDGKANQAVATLLASVLGADVELVGGASSRRKRFRVAGLSSADVADKLGVG